MTFRLYDYVGPAHLLEQAGSSIERVRVTSPSDAASWVEAGAASRREATYVVAADGELWLSDRRTEHVACARGGRVRGAGEMVVRIARGAIAIESSTNQSTGYCPEPACWAAVREALERAGLPPPEGFTYAFDFRRCPLCGSINVLKAELPECACGAELPSEWNLASP